MTSTQTGPSVVSLQETISPPLSSVTPQAEPPASKNTMLPPPRLRLLLTPHTLAHGGPEQTEPAPTPLRPHSGKRLCLEPAFDGAGPDPQASFSLSPAKFPGCSSAVRLPSPERLLAPSAAGNGPDNCSSRAGDFAGCVRTIPPTLHLSDPSSSSTPIY